MTPRPLRQQKNEWFILSEILDLATVKPERKNPVPVPTMSAISLFLLENE